MTTINETTSALPGVNVLLEGPAGTGKTHSIGTLVDSGVEVFYLALEPGLESLLGYWTDAGKPIPANLHWHTVSPPKASFKEMIANADKVNTLSYEMLTKLQDPDRSKHNQFKGTLEVLSKFVDQRTGEDFGSVDDWDTSRALVIDGLTGLNRAAMSLVVGGKPVRSMSDWGIAQNQLEGLLRMLCDNCQCHFILIAHVERETDEILGGVKLTVSTLGKALAPKIAAMFSDVVLAVRSGTKFTWDTASPMADLKTRNLPIKSDNLPTFSSIIGKWRSRGGKSLDTK